MDSLNRANSRGSFCAAARHAGDGTGHIQDMEWILGLLCLGWTTREIACLVAAARRRAQLRAWVEWTPTEAGPRLGLSTEAREIAQRLG